MSDVIPSFMGIDPGAKGAIALVYGHTVTVEDFPLHADGSIDHVRLAEIVEEFDYAKLALIEAVHAMPGQGVTSMFSFGFNAGCCVQAIASARIQWRHIPPATWKRQLGITSDKGSSVEAAVRIFPHAELLLKGPRGGLKDGRAEAILLAYLARKMWQMKGNKV